MVDSPRAATVVDGCGGGTGRLEIDVGAVVDNWRHLAREAAPAACAAVVKADAYGLSVARIAPALARAGCDRFFVATLDEALALRPLLAPSARVLVLNGVPPARLADAAASGVVPVIGDLARLDAWAAESARHPDGLPLCLQTDTGMSRLGMEAAELRALAASGAARLGRLRPILLMSHLACADDRDHPRNALQRDAFEAQRRALRALLGPVPASLSASSGIFLGPGYRFDLVRPGAALFGIAPNARVSMRRVVTLVAPCVQLREIGAGAAVGYGATFVAARPMRIATIGAGYADGFPRGGSNRGAVGWRGARLPVLGLVSMDSVTVDASAAPDLGVGDEVELIGPSRPLDAVARDAGTIGYEVLTSLGPRFARVWR